jgi:flavodoxin
MPMVEGSVLIACFSHSGNAQVVANQIKEIVGGEVFRIATVDPYPVDFDAVVEVARREQKNGSRPKLSNDSADVTSYDVVFLGYPNWWGTMPMPVFSFMEKHGFSGRKIAPFCSHEGSSLGRSVRDLKGACPQSVVLDGLAIRGGHAKMAKKDVATWLTRIGIMPK